MIMSFSSVITVEIIETATLAVAIIIPLQSLEGKSKNPKGNRKPQRIQKK
jgi:hypothetical protein